MEFVFIGICILVVFYLLSKLKKEKPSLAETYYGTNKVSGTYRFPSKIAGVSEKSKDGIKRQKLVKKLRPGDLLYLIPDRHHRHDPNAIQVMNKQGQDLGFLPSPTAADMRYEIEGGKKFFAQVRLKTGGGLFKYTGVNINVYEVEYEDY